MKVITTIWRYIAVYGLFLIGLVSTMLIFGDDKQSLDAYIMTRLILIGLSIVSFYAMYRLRTKWEAEDKLPMFKNLTNKF